MIPRIEFGLEYNQPRPFLPKTLSFALLIISQMQIIAVSAFIPARYLVTYGGIFTLLQPVIIQRSLGN